MIESRVDLPVPFFAIRPTCSRSLMVNETFQNRTRSPIRFPSNCTSIYGCIAAIDFVLWYKGKNNLSHGNYNNTKGSQTKLQAFMVLCF